MGLDYQACVFFGTFLKADASKSAELLNTVIEEYGGTPAPLFNESVGVFRVGSQPCGNEWIVVAVDYQTRWYSKSWDMFEPVPLATNPHDAERIAASLARLGIDPESLPRIGWHFAGEVS